MRTIRGWAYSFKAPKDLEARIDRARKVLGELPELDGPEGAQILDELELAILRQPHRLTQAATQSEWMRSMIDLLIVATEKVQRDKEFGEAFEEAARERTDDERSFRQDAARATARRWRDR